MGLFKSIFRFIKSCFGLAQGGTERLTDAMLTSSPDAIRNQFRKTREDKIKTYNELHSAVADLCAIRNQKSDEIENLELKVKQLETSMNGTIVDFKRTQDEKFRELYSELSIEKEKAESRSDELSVEIEKQSFEIERYSENLKNLKSEIDGLQQEEAETVADIVSNQKMQELNARLSGLSLDSQSKNIQAIREARLKSKATAQLSSEISGANKDALRKKVLASGKNASHLKSFDQAVALDKVFVETSKLEKLPEPSKAIDDLFS